MFGHKNAIGVNQEWAPLTKHTQDGSNAGRVREEFGQGGAASWKGSLGHLLGLMSCKLVSEA